MLSKTENESVGQITLGAWAELTIDSLAPPGGELLVVKTVSSKGLCWDALR